MERETPLVSNETYHVFNRGAHKYNVFTSEDDSNRFLALLHLANNSKAINLRNVLEKKKYRGRLSREIFNESADKSLVDVLAFALLPNHFHLILKQKTEEGISKFIQKVATSYSMYFNLKYDHSGVLFQGRFKSSHLDTDPYCKWIFPYVHLNPVSLVEPEWQDKGIAHPKRADEFLKTYPFSSYYDYYVSERPERAILAYAETTDLIDRKSDMLGLLASYRRGHQLYNH